MPGRDASWLYLGKKVGNAGRRMYFTFLQVLWFYTVFLITFIITEQKLYYWKGTILYILGKFYGNDNSNVNNNI